jgi:hypothetical protein
MGIVGAGHANMNGRTPVQGRQTPVLALRDNCGESERLTFSGAAIPRSPTAPRPSARTANILTIPCVEGRGKTRNDRRDDAERSAARDSDNAVDVVVARGDAIVPNLGCTQGRQTPMKTLRPAIPPPPPPKGSIRRCVLDGDGDGGGGGSIVAKVRRTEDEKGGAEMRAWGAVRRRNDETLSVRDAATDPKRDCRILTVAAPAVLVDNILLGPPYERRRFQRRLLLK